MAGDQKQAVFTYEEFLCAYLKWANEPPFIGGIVNYERRRMWDTYCLIRDSHIIPQGLSETSQTANFHSI